MQIDATQTNANHAFDLIRVRLGGLFHLFDEAGVTEVNLNGRSGVFCTRRGSRVQVTVPDISEISVASAVRELASSMGQEATASTTSCIVDAKMPGFRFSAVLAPVASSGTILSIRKHSPSAMSLAEFVERGDMTESLAEVLIDAVQRGENILIGGGTDTGKTTFLNALAREIPPEERVGSIEDTRELNLLVANWVPMESNTQRGVTPTLLLKALMRHSPDRIICGELRDGVAADFVSAANTGHHGCMATVHCNSAALALERMEDLCLQNPIQWPLEATQRNIARSIHMVVQLAKRNGRRLVKEVLKVDGLERGTGAYNVIPIFQRSEQ